MSGKAVWGDEPAIPPSPPPPTSTEEPLQKPYGIKPTRGVRGGEPPSGAPYVVVNADTGKPMRANRFSSAAAAFLWAYRATQLRDDWDFKVLDRSLRPVKKERK